MSVELGKSDLEILLDSILPKNKKWDRQTYDWKRLANGSVHLLEPGVDYKEIEKIKRATSARNHIIRVTHSGEREVLIRTIKGNHYVGPRELMRLVPWKQKKQKA